MIQGGGLECNGPNIHVTLANLDFFVLGPLTQSLYKLHHVGPKFNTIFSFILLGCGQKMHMLKGLCIRKLSQMSEFNRLNHSLPYQAKYG